METKLIKVLEHYHLYAGDKAIATTIVGNPMLLPNLSLKNCEAIERGYDLGELAMGYDLYENINFVGQTRAYKAGFQKALSILGYKKFSDEQLRTAYNVGYTDGKDGATFYNRFIQSLQQTEWDVEIVMETCQVMVQHGDMEFQDFPKLDADGCIILKRK